MTYKVPEGNDGACSYGEAVDAMKERSTPDYDGVRAAARAVAMFMRGDRYFGPTVEPSEKGGYSHARYGEFYAAADQFDGRIWVEVAEDRGRGAAVYWADFPLEVAALIAAAYTDMYDALYRLDSEQGDEAGPNEIPPFVESRERDPRYQP